MIEAHARARERDSGDFTGKAADPIVQPPVAVPASTKHAGQDDVESASFDLVVADYLAEQRGVSLEWRQAMKSAVLEFQQFIGPNVPLKSIQRSKVAAYKAALGRVSSSAVRSGSKPTFKAWVERGIPEGESPLANSSINRRLSVLSKFGAWAVQHGHTEINPFSGFSLEKRSRSRRPFSEDMLQKIFSSPMFTGCKSANRGNEGKIGFILIDDWRFWAMPIALFTGARLGEILQLLVEDIILIDGLYFINVNKMAKSDGTPSGKRIKTDSSERFIPIHSELVNMGLIDYQKYRKGRGDIALFPGIKRDNLGRLATMPSKFLNSYLKRIKVKAGADLVFHSFRHTLIDALRKSGIRDLAIASVVGHQDGDGPKITGDYGEELPVPLLSHAQKSAVIEKARFSSVDFAKFRAGELFRRSYS